MGSWIHDHNPFPHANACDRACGVQDYIGFPCEVLHADNVVFHRFCRESTTRDLPCTSLAFRELESTITLVEMRTEHLHATVGAYSLHQVGQ